MGKKDIKKHEFKKGESGNPKGRPKKFINEVLSDLKENGAEQVTKQLIVSVYETMISLTEQQLKDIFADTSKQMLYRIIAKGILSKRGFDIIERMLDRVHGKPKQTQDVNNKTELLADGLNIIIPDPSPDIMKKFNETQFDDD